MHDTRVWPRAAHPSSLQSNISEESYSQCCKQGSKLMFHRKARCDWNPAPCLWGASQAFLPPLIWTHWDTAPVASRAHIIGEKASSLTKTGKITLAKLFWPFPRGTCLSTSQACAMPIGVMAAYFCPALCQAAMGTGWEESCCLRSPAPIPALQAQGSQCPEGLLPVSKAQMQD